jgi:hypothetical protein
MNQKHPIYAALYRLLDVFSRTGEEDLSDLMCSCINLSARVVAKDINVNV